MTDLTDMPTAQLIAELKRRESALEAELSSLIDWRSPAPITCDCAEIGQRIVTEVASKFAVRDHDIMGRRRTPKIARARQTAMVALHQAGYSLCEVGRFFDRDHGTVIHALKVIKQSPAIP